jgi:hypothetical protein
MDGSQRTSPCKLPNISFGSFPMSRSDEHQKRSPDCSFFTLYASIKPKKGRPKRSRASKASRMSTQSNLTAVSEVVSMAETEGHPDETMISTVESVKPVKTAKGGTKVSRSTRAGSKAGEKAAKSKEEESQIIGSPQEPEDDDFEVKVAPSPVVVGRSNKRKSEDMSTPKDSHANLQDGDNKVESELPPAKRRITRARASVAQTQETSTSALLGEDVLDRQMTDVEGISPPSAPVLKKKGKGSKKRASSNTRKASTASTASKASLRAGVPNDEEIDAALEADLDRPLTDDESEAEVVELEQPKGRRLTRTKPGSRKATASVAPTRRGTRASSVIVDEPPTTNIYPSLRAAAEPALDNGGESMQSRELTTLSPEPKNPDGDVTHKASVQQQNHNESTEVNVETQGEIVTSLDETPSRVEAPTSKSQQPRSRQASRQLPTRNTRASNIPRTNGVADLASDVNSPKLDTQTLQDDSGHETDAGGLDHKRTKATSKKAVGAKKKAKNTKKAAKAASNKEAVVQEPRDETQGEQTVDAPTVAPSYADNAGLEAMESVLLEDEIEVTKGPKPLETKGNAAKTKTTVQKATVNSSPEQSTIMMEIQNTRVSPPPPLVHMTPPSAPSPQSSDAENQPPSSLPSTFRPPLSTQSPSKSQMTRIPLAVTTPITSPFKGNSSKLQSSMPWTAIDLRQVFTSTPDGNEGNDPLAFSMATGSAQNELTSPEKVLTVEQWIQFNAQRGENKLRSECERQVGTFEDEGLRALRTLEGIVCTQ